MRNYKIINSQIYLILLLTFLIIFFLFISCGKRLNSNDAIAEKSLTSNAGFKELSSQSSKSSFTNESESQSDLQNNIQTSTNVQDYLIYTANIRGKVSYLDDFEEKILELVRSTGGYISSIEKYNDDEIFITFKVPKANFYKDLSSLKKLFISIENERVQIEDISQQYIDLNARLNSKKEAEKRYLALLQKTNSVKDIIEIEQALRQIREEIESYEANLRYYNNSIQYSTITVNAYIQKIKIDRENFLTRFVRSISIGFNYLVSTFLFIISLWPFLIIVILAFFIFKKVKIRSKKQKNESNR
ncbi:MAG: DUF4349 domain-containing protein [Exilispira sp.]|nr:DUF4349 domain-containing protein [Exilispira sp.]